MDAPAPKYWRQRRYPTRKAAPAQRSEAFAGSPRREFENDASVNGKGTASEQRDPPQTLAADYVTLATSRLAERYRDALFWIVEHFPENWDALKATDAKPMRKSFAPCWRRAA